MRDGQNEALWDLPPIGYEALVRDLGIEVLPHHVRSFVGRYRKEVTEANGQQRKEYPASYRPSHESELIGHLEFALKYEGVHLGILKEVFLRAGTESLTSYIRSRPTGKYARRLWFLAEWLLGEALDVPDLSQGNWVALLDETDYFTSPRRRKSPRHRIWDNLLGTKELCPFVRRTPALEEWASVDLATRAKEIMEAFDPALLSRAADFLYAKETRASFAIERETPSQDRATRFVEILREAHAQSTVDRARLIALQNAIVEPRYTEDDFRSVQNYVGQSLLHREVIHYVCPKPEDVESLMLGFFDALERMTHRDLDPVVAAAAIAFAFVYIHPFVDGNGRLHRFLIHHALSVSGFTPDQTVLPVSATILADRRAYDVCLEKLSKPIAHLVHYELDPEGVMTVKGDTADLYRYMDLTAAAEYLYATLQRTVEKDFPDELEFLMSFDTVREQIRRVVDLPDQKLNLFVKLTSQNRGHLNASKRKRHFAELDDEEIDAMEAAVREAFFDKAAGPGTE